jgi:hypothetical protein
MGVVQSGGGARFALKAFQSLAVLGKMFRRNFKATKRPSLMSSAL